MKVIFLDIDGVLNCKKTPNPRRLPYIVDRRLLSRFKRLLDRTGAKVVLSSTWRYDPAGVFSAKHCGIPFIDVTPDMPKRPRRDEILAGLKKHPKVTRFVVIDDQDDELDKLPLFHSAPSRYRTNGRDSSGCRQVSRLQNKPRYAQKPSRTTSSERAVRAKGTQDR